MQGSFKSKIKYFFYETFRPRSREEYAEVFSRGLKGGEDGAVEKRDCPWLYIRVFALLFVLFTVTVLAYRLTGYSIGFITAVIIGGLLFNIPLLVAFFELYPKKDISLLTLFSLVLIGGSVTGSVILLGYEFIYEGNDNPWISYLWTGFWEELIKAAFALSAITLLKKKNPVCCFLIGFAVGTGYSFFEDAGYIYMYGRGGAYGVTGYGWLVIMSVARGFSCVCSHAPWTAVICWAFAQFEKPLLNVRFYAVVVSSMLLHYLADVPFYAEEVSFLSGLNWGWAIEIFVVAAIFLEMYFMLRRSFKDFNSETYAAERNSGGSYAVECNGDGSYAVERSFVGLKHMWQNGNAVAIICAAVLCITALVGCSVKTGYENKTVVFNAADSVHAEEKFVQYMQDGYSFHADWRREYDENLKNYSEYAENGTLKCATQQVTADGCDYYYVYSLVDGAYVLASVGTKVDGIVFYCHRIIIYEDYSFVNYGNPPRYDPITDDEIIVDDPDKPDKPDEGEEPEEPEEPVVVPQPLKVVSYFPVNVDVVHARYEVETGSFVITTFEKEFKGLGAVIALSAIGGFTLIGGAAAFITLKLKFRRR